MHKFYKEDTLNIVNYMSQFQRDDFDFLGFIKLHENWGYNWGSTLDNCQVVAVHLSRDRVTRPICDDSERELNDIKKQKYWVLMFYGSDNTSYAKRFKTEKAAMEYFQKNDKLTRSEGLIYYNS